MKRALLLIVFSYVCSCTRPPESKIALAWDPIPGAVGYNVYRSETPGCCYRKINTDPVPAPNYTDTSVKAGKPYYYRVTSVNSNGVESGFSEEINAVPKQ